MTLFHPPASIPVVGRLGGVDPPSFYRDGGGTGESGLKKTPQKALLNTPQAGLIPVRLEMTLEGGPRSWAPGIRV